ncbi:MAG: hypothetical protein IJX19_09515, partial [Clostridia bacterium]|nr:hypothetical protein [Clostridia bacterium]
IFSAIFVYRIIRDVTFSKIIENNGLSIVKYTVSRISRDEVPKNHAEGLHTVNVIYFSKHGRCVAPKVRTPFDLSAPGVEFYLVVLHEKEEIVFAYNSIMYDCNELDVFQ